MLGLQVAALRSQSVPFRAQRLAVILGGLQRVTNRTGLPARTCSLVTSGGSGGLLFLRVSFGAPDFLLKRLCAFFRGFGECGRVSADELPDLTHQGVGCGGGRSGGRSSLFSLSRLGRRHNWLRLHLHAFRCRCDAGRLYVLDPGGVDNGKVQDTRGVRALQDTKGFFELDRNTQIQFDFILLIVDISDNWDVPLDVESRFDEFSELGGRELALLDSEAARSVFKSNVDCKHGAVVLVVGWLLLREQR
mmetsp:Transcript_19736/g.29077  ORF Transcript_19736/g.29077 Transcript_19736/m.29077 type:complete len:248 (+) Transcript_19736:736-1479(+)